MSDFQRKPHLFGTKGLGLSSDPTLQLPEKYQKLLNVRPVLEGTLEARQGLTRFTPIPMPEEVHSIRRLNDLSGGYTYIVGAGSKVFEVNSAGAWIERSASLSGDPVSLVAYRPESSPETFMYAADKQLTRKYKAGLSGQKVGIPPPATAPTVTLEVPQYTVIDELVTTGSWALGGTATALAAGTRLASTTITAIPSLGGWGIFTVASLTEAIQAGMRLRVNDGGGSAEYIHVDQVMAAPTLVNRVHRIAFDSGISGWATITFTHNTTGVRWDAGIQVNSVLLIGDGVTSERTWIRGIIEGPADARCVRVFLTGSHSNWVAAALSGTLTVVWNNAIRVYTANTHAAGESINLPLLSFKVSDGEGYAQLVATKELNWMQTGGIARDTKPDDYMHISLKLDNSSKMVSGRLYLDCASDSVSGGTFTGTAFTKNYFYVDFDQTNLNSEQPKQDQWSELFFRVSDLVRVGADQSRSLATIVGLRIEFRAWGAAPGADMVCSLTSWYIRGGFGPDFTATAIPFQYRYRGRSSSTGAKGNASPANLAQTPPPLRGRIKLSLVQHPDIFDGLVDKLDIFRFGGGINEWRYIGTVENSATPTFNDEIEPTAPAASDLLDEDQDEPFPVADVTRLGTCQIIGMAVKWQSGDVFDVRWKPGQPIFVDERLFILYSVLSSTLLLLTQSTSVDVSNVSFTVPSPVLMAQPLPALWGPFEGSLFACGGTMNPGFMSWTKGNDADAAPEAYHQEITQGAGEPLVNGLIHDTRNFVFSTDNLYALYPSPGGDRSFWTAYRTACGRGLWSRFGLCSGGGKIWFIWKDGIYVTDGGPSESITDEDLYPIFPREGSPGTAINEYNPVDMAQRNYLRLAWHENKLYFDYKDTLGNPRTLIYEPGHGWYSDTYGPSTRMRYASEGAGVRDLLLGGRDGHIYTVGGADDAGSGIACVVRTFSDDGGDAVAKKFLGDAAVNLDPGGRTINSRLFYDDQLAELVLPAITGSTRAQVRLDVSSGAGQLLRNAALQFSWTGRGPRLHHWEIAFVQKSEDQQARVVEWHPFIKDAPAMDAYVYGIRLWADTEGQNKSVQIWKDQGNTGITITVNSNGERPLEFTWPEFIGHLGRLVPTNTVPWRVTAWEWFKIPAPSALLSWRTTATSLGLKGFGHAQKGYITLISTAGVTMSVSTDGGTPEVYTIASTNGLKQKVLLMLRPNKGKLYDVTFSSTVACRLYKEDCEFWIKQWGSDDAYQPVKLFGGPSAQYT